MTDLEHKTKRVEELEAGNQRSYEELRKVTQGRFRMDTSDLRRELFIDNLVKWGIVTEEQVMDFEIEFHEQVEKALNTQWEKFREAAKPNLTVVKQNTSLLDQHGRPIA